MKIAKLLLLAGLVAGVAGCTALRKSHPLLTAQETVLWKTNTVTTVVTNTEVKTVAGVNVTNTVLIPVVQQVPVPYTNVEYVVSKGTEQVLSGAETVSSFLPPPVGTIVGSVVSVGSLLLALYGKLLSGRYQTVIKAVAAGVEATNVDAVKTAIQQHAVAAGVQGILDPIVQAVSKEMPAPPPASQVTK